MCSATSSYSEATKAITYRNRPFEIGHGQTIAQPFIIGLTTDLLDVKFGEKVLEVGTGSAYQAAVLAELGVKVYDLNCGAAWAPSRGAACGAGLSLHRNPDR